MNDKIYIDKVIKYYKNISSELENIVKDKEFKIKMYENKNKNNIVEIIDKKTNKKIIIGTYNVVVVYDIITKKLLWSWDLKLISNNKKFITNNETSNIFQKIDKKFITFFENNNNNIYEKNDIDILVKILIYVSKKGIGFLKKNKENKTIYIVITDIITL
jgi:hypothetical protein